jgi:hypothetical protein
MEEVFKISNVRRREKNKIKECMYGVERRKREGKKVNDSKKRRKKGNQISACYITSSNRL